MFHAFDTEPAERPLDRAQWMATLARAPLDMLEPALGAHAQRAPHWLRPPETGLVMVQGRAGGTGERFNVGEVTVTRCALRLGDVSDAVGVAYVLGRSHRHAQLAAVADALLQDPAQQATLNTQLLVPVRRHLALQRAKRHARAQSSKVEFFTVAREAGGADEEEGDE
ncbi:phosphonate C-P lyase system protein PhnG [Variovorax sp. EL159]|uniref:phosphonate C-P lyase system protein PhnG n=1 Tax=Variovorax sp. EL159 TaxID=1566270 RepID=UPI000891B7C1|nr:phosphonate C-P lyase system protein PhnG [Variovorax sp. EL159]SCX61013.1 alpha-D-ribose 1-methylphosphonate 5-triphosphate synthase subunit PhnG [Variovorax sp. EL159]